MSIGVIVAFIAITFLAFAIGYMAGWLDGRERQHHLDEIPRWVRRTTTEGADDAL